jgi:hypothetical protein
MNKVDNYLTFFSFYLVYWIVIVKREDTKESVDMADGLPGARFSNSTKIDILKF